MYTISCACERGLRKWGHSSAPLDLQISLSTAIGTPRTFQKAHSMVQHKAKQTQCFPPVLPGLDEEQVPFPNSHHLLQHSPRWHLHWLHNHPSRDAKHPREPRPLQIEPFSLLDFAVQNWRTAQIFFPACFHTGGGCVCAQRKHCVWLHIP